MTTANEEFRDLMPHRIRVSTKGTSYDDYGKAIAGVGTRDYACLIDDTTTVQRTADGREIIVALTAYVAPVPVDSSDGEPVDIESTEKIEILSPRPDPRPTIGSIERHYDSEDGVGMLHNLVIRFV